ncbi:hypothetical protein WICPIJ_002416 [Wickerhamomyces pijperi]|uniref:ERCC1-like central domain-containing protein n=1 Tax=Wickerhamomyces pijperi TaxID=599730 RepID=A0A9P8Q9S6_WICPI|nr:hypothetical protein WICPIJ_002416 [Wickerhamomyces pijperi]
MSDQSTNNQKVTQQQPQPTPAADSTSFASILANVQRLREQQSGSSSSQLLQPRTTDNQNQLNQPIQHNRTLPNQRTPQDQQQQQQQRSAQRLASTTLSKRVNSLNLPNTTTSQSQSHPQTSKRQHTSSSSILKINKNQTGNPLLTHLTNLSWEYVSKHLPYDYLIPPHQNNNKIIGNRPIIFLSLKYHKLHPEHLPMKLKVNKNFNTTTASTEAATDRTTIPIVLVYVDVERYDTIIDELNYLSVFEGFTLLLAWGWEECAVWIKGLVQGK